MKGIEPSSEAWEATALPLSYTRLPCIFQVSGALTIAEFLNLLGIHRVSYMKFLMNEQQNLMLVKGLFAAYKK